MTVRLMGLAFMLVGCSFVGVDDLQSGAAGGGTAATAGSTGQPAGSGSGGSANTTSEAATSTVVSSGTGDGGRGGEGGQRGAPSRCPEGMVLAESAALDVAFCIDATEATQAQYLAFLLDVGDASSIEQPAECATNTELTNPVPSCPDFDVGNELPVFCLDWCDARAYCAWAGKRLCGRIGGGPHAPLDATITQEEWNFACTRGLTRKFPYGDAPIPGACHIPQENTPETGDDSQKAPVGTNPACEGGFDGIFDMQGNVAEWVDWCGIDAEGDDVCRARGGHTYGTAAYWECGNLDQAEARLDAGVQEVGVRCCADAAPE